MIIVINPDFETAYFSWCIYSELMIRSNHRYKQFFSNLTGYLQAIFISVLLLYFGKPLFVPILFGLLVALISYPACVWLERRGWKRSLAIFLLLIVLFKLFFVLVWLMGYELNLFFHDLPRITEKIDAYSPQIQSWIRNNFGISQDTQVSWLEKTTQDMQSGFTGFLRAILNTTISTLFMLIMIPIFASLFLYHRGTFIKFLESLAGLENHARFHRILDQSIHSYFNFVKGTFFVYLIVGTLNSAGLLLLGIQHAILYGFLSAFMTIIPYVGIIISASMPVAIALVTKDSLWYPAGVILVFTLVQYLEANVIFPKVVGAQLNLTTWSTLVAIIAGTLLWGVAGAILFIPMLSIFKIISEQTDELKSLRILLSR